LETLAGEYLMLLPDEKILQAELERACRLLGS
jgi:hypothetical protein